MLDLFLDRRMLAVFRWSSLTHLRNTLTAPSS